MARFDMGSAESAILAGQVVDGQVYYELGCLHASGRSTAPDLVAAHTWFNIAAARGCREAAARRAELAGEMTRDEIAAAQRQARLFLTRH